MNDKRKEYLKKWREDNKEHISNYRKEYAKTHDSSFKKLQDKYKQLQEENKQLKEVIDRAKTELEQGITFCQNDSQGLYDKCNIAINREQRILDILKGVE